MSKKKTVEVSYVIGPLALTRTRQMLEIPDSARDVKCVVREYAVPTEMEQEDIVRVRFPGSKKEYCYVCPDAVSAFAETGRAIVAVPPPDTTFGKPRLLAVVGTGRTDGSPRLLRKATYVNPAMLEVL